MKEEKGLVGIEVEKEDFMQKRRVKYSLGIEGRLVWLGYREEG